MTVKHYRIIDSHAHIFPTKIAPKAVASIGRFYNIPMCEDGTSEALIAEGATIGVEKFIVHSTATTVHQVRSINDFIWNEACNHSEFIPFMTLHPLMSEAAIAEEVDLAVSRGIKGVKLHPDFQCFNIDEADNIYRYVEGKLPILFHMGDPRYDYSSPQRLKIVAEKYTDLICIGAHFGGYSCWNKVDCLFGFDNIFYDTSSSLAFITPEYARELMDKLKVSHFFFGVDYPMWKHTAEYERFLQLPLTDAERQAVLAENIERLLKI